MQVYWIGHGEFARQIVLPPADAEVLRGIAWGRADMLDTPAYWALQCSIEDNPLHGFVSNSASLLEEVGFCLLGGFGITAELNEAAFRRLKKEGVFSLKEQASEATIRALLLRPLDVRGRKQRYRFPNQRATRLSFMLRHFAGVDLDRMPLPWIEKALRDVPGIGPKTAAWIIRNHFESDQVAILDVHVIKACVRLGLFPNMIRLQRDYEVLQDRFISFANALNVRPAILDAIMWRDMRSERKSSGSLAA